MKKMRVVANSMSPTSGAAAQATGSHLPNCPRLVLQDLAFFVANGCHASGATILTRSVSDASRKKKHFKSGSLPPMPC